MNSVRVKSACLLAHREDFPAESGSLPFERYRTALGLDPNAASLEASEGQNEVRLPREIVPVDVWLGAHVLIHAEGAEDEAGLSRAEHLSKQLHRSWEGLAGSTQSRNATMHKDTCTEGSLGSAPARRPSRNLLREPPEHLKRFRDPDVGRPLLGTLPGLEAASPGLESSGKGASGQSSLSLGKLASELARVQAETLQKGVELSEVPPEGFLRARAQAP